MPEKEGIETIRALWCLDPAIPIIAITGGPAMLMRHGNDVGNDYLEMARALDATEQS